MIKMKTLTIGGVTYEVVDAGLTENVVMHKEQNLTEEQQSKARENIGAAENGHGHTTDDISGLGSLATKSTVEKTDLSSDVQTSLGKADTALQSYTETDPTVPAWAKASTKPSYTKSEVGLGNVDNVKQYSASNPPPYPVTSVNGKTGAVTVSAVPSCTTSNNGQFLRVVNGVAAWSTIPSAEEASF